MDFSGTVSEETKGKVLEITKEVMNYLEDELCGSEILISVSGTTANVHYKEDGAKKFHISLTDGTELRWSDK